jgi:hypothetical protein
MKKIVVIAGVLLGLLYWYMSGGYSWMKFTYMDTVKAPRVVLTIQCGKVNIIAEEDERYERGIWAMGTRSRLEPEYSVRLERDNRSITFARTFGENIPLHLPIQSGFLFGDYFHRATTPGEVDYGSGYNNYSQEWYIDAGEMDSESFASLARCMYEHKSELESVPLEFLSSTGPGLQPTAPIRGVYLLPDTSGWQAAHFDPPMYGKGMWKVFSCTDGSSVRVKTAQYIEHSSTNGVFNGPWGIDPEGRVGFAHFADENQRKASQDYNLSSCVDENEIPLTQFYKQRVALLKRLY